MTVAAPWTIRVDDRDVTDREARELLSIPEGACVGCWLGDAGPDAHDFGFGCEWGGAA